MGLVSPANIGGVRVHSRRRERSHTRAPAARGAPAGRRVGGRAGGRAASKKLPCSESACPLAFLSLSLHLSLVDNRARAGWRMQNSLANNFSAPTLQPRRRRRCVCRPGHVPQFVIGFPHGVSESVAVYLRIGLTNTKNIAHLAGGTRKNLVLCLATNLKLVSKSVT